MYVIVDYYFIKIIKELIHFFIFDNKLFRLRISKSPMFIKVILLNILIGLFIFSYLPGQNKVKLSNSEYNYLRNTNIEILAGYQAPPNSYYNEEGKHVGICVDYLELVTEQINITFSKKKLQDWDTTISYAKNHKDFIITGIAKTPQREKYLLFTEPFIRMPNVILTNNNSDIYTLKDLHGKRVSTVKNYAVTEFLRKKHKDLIIQEVITDYDGIKRLINGEIDAMVINQLSASYIISEKGLTNLRICEEIGYTNKLCIAVSNKNPQLFQILSKVTNSISDKETQKIYSKWANLTRVKFSSKLRYIILIIIVIIIVSYIGTWYWLSSMKRLVFIKTQEIRDSESKYRELVENSYDAIFVQYKGKFLMVNNKFAELFGYTKEQFINGEIKIEDITAPDSMQIINDRLEKIERKEPLSLQYNINGITSDHKKLNLTISVSYIPHEDGSATQGIIHNMTEQFNKEKELRIAKERAEESDCLKSAFLANMSHEIRTPMNGILGFSEILKSSDISESERIQFIDIIQESGNRMLNTINDIIDISKIHAGQVSLSMSEINLKEEMNSLYNFFKPLAEKKNIKLVLDYNCSDPLIITDLTKFISILSNLIKNAINYSNQGEIEIHLCKDENQLLTWVKDTGIGIPEDRLSNIFERFTQVNGNNSRLVQGSGLGLAIVHSYVHMLAGKIEVESKLGVGSKFVFTIPWRTF